jgi:hypothetical protein
MAVDGAFGQLVGRCNLRPCKVFETVADKNGPRQLREFSNCIRQRRQRLLACNDSGRIERVHTEFVVSRKVTTVVGPVFLLARAVAKQIDRDLKDVRFGRTHIDPLRAREPDKYVLRHIFGLGVIAQAAQEERHQCGPEGPIQLIEFSKYISSHSLTSDTASPI